MIRTFGEGRFMANVRPYEHRDKDDVRRICLETSGLPTKEEKDRKFLFYMYNDYYTEFEPESCFVLTDGNDVAQGYILCAKDFENYAENMEKFYLPRILQLGHKYYFMAKYEMFLHGLYKKRFPAHLHIDISPSFQGKGGGTALVTALKAHLKESGVKAVMLSAGEGNKRALAFYKKNGFKTVSSILGCRIMAFETA